MLKGYRTIILNGLAVIYLVLPMIGIDVPLPEQESITAGVLAIMNLGLRKVTTTPVGEA